jgi:cadmium resistance protein CadD (predicted permease)
MGCVALLSVIGVAIALFISTNIDDVFLLVAFFANPAFRARQVVIGQFLGIGALIAVSLAGSALALVASEQHLGLLGMLPFAIGLYGLIQRLRGVDEDDDDTQATPRTRNAVATVALITIANGGDNASVYVPVFATRTPAELVAITVVFLVLTAALCWLGHALVSHPRLGPPIRRIAGPLTPIVLMLVGILIILDSEAYRLVTG